jgi:hypothetical protein
METLLEVSNECVCDNEADYTSCYGGCWEQSLEDFSIATEELRESNETDYWKVENVRLWSGSVSGHFQAKTVEDILRGMSVNGSWNIRYKVFSDRIEYSLAHHDAPMGSNSVLRPMTEEEYEVVRW